VASGDFPLRQGNNDSLERLCNAPCGRNRIRLASGAEGIERLEAHLHGHAFSPHRHDTYAIGITLSGIQTFHFRGQSWHCLPGQCHILHPDETHDGGAGTDAGFSYRMVYIDPALVRTALRGKPLPFVGNPVVDAARLPDCGAAEIWDFDADIDDIARTGAVVAVADLLAASAPCANSITFAGCYGAEPRSPRPRSRPASPIRAT